MNTRNALLIFVLGFFSIRAIAAAATPPKVVRVETAIGGAVNDGGPATEGFLFAPMSFVYGPDGCLYIGDRWNHRVRKVDKNGTISTVMGTGNWSPSIQAGLPALATDCPRPYSLFFDSDGRLVVASEVTSSVFRLEHDGNVSRIAGNGAVGAPIEGALATETPFFELTIITLDPTGHLVLCDRQANRVFRIDDGGHVHAIAGTGNPGYAGNEGPALSAELYYPKSLAYDAAGRLYIGDQTSIRRLDPDGILHRVAGDQNAASDGDGGPALDAHLWWPNMLFVDRDGSLLESEWHDHVIRRIGPDGIIQRILGTGVHGSAPDGSSTTAMPLNAPHGIIRDPQGRLMYAETDSHRICRIDPDGIMHVVAGQGHGGFYGEGQPGHRVELNYPRAAFMDRKGQLWVADTLNGRIRVMGADNLVVTKLASTDPSGYVQQPSALLEDPDGSILIADQGSERIYRYSVKDGSVQLIAGSGLDGPYADHQPAAKCSLLGPSGLAWDQQGRLLVADTGHHVIRRLDPISGMMDTVAGTGTAGFNGDGIDAPATQLNSPAGIAVLPNGGLCIADSQNQRIRIVQPDGRVATLIGNGTFGVLGDNLEGRTASTVSLRLPYGLTVGPDGLLYFSEYGGEHIGRLDGDGTLTMFGGFAYGYSNDGADPRGGIRTFWGPQGIAFGPDGALYIADTMNLRIRRLWIDPKDDPTPTGDVDGDGKVTVRDALAWSHWVDGRRDPSLRDLRQGDLNRTGQPDRQDVFLICRKCIPGDVKGTGTLDIGNAVVLLQDSIGLRQPEQPEIWVGDLNHNGRIDIQDVIAVLKQINQAAAT